jgi:tellurite methyltransferase
MERQITEFRRDEADDWVARLDCGHTRHVRHVPPLSERPWVNVASERAAHVGAPLDCVGCDRRELPEGFASVRRTPTFDETSIPAGLLRDHTTKAGTWGLIHVEHGRLRFVEAGRETVLTPGTPGVVLPEVAHAVEPIGEVAFFVEFHRARG